MPLSVGKAQLRNALLQLANNENSNMTKEEAVDTFLNGLEEMIKSSLVKVPGEGLVAGPYPVTGLSVTGTLE